MGISKDRKIIILLAIDCAFCLVELYFGYTASSLCLITDACHMLNDVMSLCVGLWAVRRAKQGRSDHYTFGWQRAETLGALVNGVFLIALCFSIFFQIIDRLLQPKPVKTPETVLAVGAAGLVSNIVGLILFHDVGHSHSHSHNPTRSAEEGHVDAAERGENMDETILISASQGNIKHVSPFERFTTWVRGLFLKRSHTRPKTKAAAGGAYRDRATSFPGSIDAMPTHPVGRRDTIINFSKSNDVHSDTQTEESSESEDESSALVKAVDAKNNGYGSINGSKDTHANHKHGQPLESKSGISGHGHSHGDLNMRGVFLHVLGDALGNVGVIASALIIWLTKSPYRFIADPAISFVIMLIILNTAWPLCKAASRILLQAVPMGTNIADITANIKRLDGVKSAHHIHVWQLTDTKLVASLHVKIDPKKIENPGSEGYMRLAKDIETCLRGYGIRSSTIQPEFEDADTLETIEEEVTSNANGSTKQTITRTNTMSRQNSLRDDRCMLDSEDAGEVVGQEEPHHDHEHNRLNGNGNGKSKQNHQH